MLKRIDFADNECSLYPPCNAQLPPRSTQRSSPPSLFTDSAGTAKPEPYLITGMASERQLPQLPPNSMYGFDMADMTNMDTLPLGNCLLVFA